MDCPDIIYTKEGHIATITLNRPERLNAFSLVMIDSIQKALHDAAADDEIRVIVMTGAGRGFCSGADLKEPRGVRGEFLSEVLLQAIQTPIITDSIDKPIIASINGPAIGWGFELALLCDIRIAAENALIGDPHVTYGVVDDNGGLFFLPRLVGWAKACELAFIGTPIDGKEAERIGLVNKAVPLEQLATATRAMADTIASRPPLAVQLTKRGMREGLTSDLKAVQHHSIVLLRQLFANRAPSEGMSTGTEKRDS